MFTLQGGGRCILCSEEGVVYSVGRALYSTRRGCILCREGVNTLQGGVEYSAGTGGGYILR